MKRRIRMVSNWQRAWRWYSVNMPMLAAALLATWATLPEKLQDSFTPTELKLIALTLVVLGVAGRLIDQTPSKEDA